MNTRRTSQPAPVRAVCLIVVLCLTRSEAATDDELQRHRHRIPVSDSAADLDISAAVCHIEGDQLKGIEECLSAGREFVINYSKSLRKNHNFDKCSHYSHVTGCLRRHVDFVRTRCPDDEIDDEVSVTSFDARDRQSTIVDQLRDWVPVVEHLDAVCGPNRTKEVVHRQRCLDDELRGLLSKRCDEFYKFNVKQKTRHECHFLKERIRCKQALVSSACGAEAGNFAYSIGKLSVERATSRHRCQIPRDGNYDGFSYNDACPVDYLQQIESCTSRHLTEKNIIVFHEENDLIARGSERAVKNACRTYKRFSHCIEPIASTCKQGIDQLLDYETRLRRYVLKMDYICNDSVVEVYSSNLACYQRLVTQKTLVQCDVYWTDLSPWLSNITSYQFYCQPDHLNTVNLLAELNKLPMCYGTVVAASCGVGAGSVLSDLIATALHDPVYLRLDYRADCALHDDGRDGGGSSDPSAVLPSVTEQRPNSEDDEDDDEKQSPHPAIQDRTDDDPVAAAGGPSGDSDDVPPAVVVVGDGGQDVAQTRSTVGNLDRVDRGRSDPVHSASGDVDGPRSHSSGSSSSSAVRSDSSRSGSAPIRQTERWSAVFAAAFACVLRLLVDDQS